MKKLKKKAAAPYVSAVVVQGKSVCVCVGGGLPCYNGFSTHGWNQLLQCQSHNWGCGGNAGTGWGMNSCGLGDELIKATEVLHLSASYLCFIWYDWKSFGSLKTTLCTDTALLVQSVILITLENWPFFHCIVFPVWALPGWTQSVLENTSWKSTEKSAISMGHENHSYHWKLWYSSNTKAVIFCICTDFIVNI